MESITLIIEFPPNASMWSGSKAVEIWV